MDASAYIRASQGNPIAIDYLRAQAYGAVRFHAPPHFFLEVANALRNSSLVQKGARDGVGAPLRALLRTKFEIDDDTELAVDALDFALKRGITVYDAAYAVLALQRGATLVTTDSGLDQAARAAGVAVTLITGEVS